MSSKPKKHSRKEREAQERHAVEAADAADPPAAVAPSSPASTAAAAAAADAIRLFSAASPRQDSMVLHAVSTPAEVAAALRTLSAEKVLSVDCEGVSLSRTGQLCLLQLSTPAHQGLFHVFLFDILALGAGAFNTGLGALLEDASVTKLFYDVRRDAESLAHQYGVRVRGVCDMQLLEVSLRRVRGAPIVYLPGLARLLGDKFPHMEPGLQRIKDGMSSRYQAEPDLWRKRPLSREQQVYAAVDVALLHVLREEHYDHIEEEEKQQRKAAKKAKKAAEAAATEGVTMEDEATASDAAEKSIELALSRLSGSNGSSPAAAAAASSAPSSHRQLRLPSSTLSIVSAYSDLVWANSMRDLVGDNPEPDEYSRRHVPVVFAHATFPLSLAAEVSAVQEREKAKAEAERSAKEESATDASKAGGKKKRKTPATSAAEAAAAAAPKIAASFSASAPAAAAAAAPSAASTASSNLSSFVQRLSRTPAARANYSGLANTLKHMRKQQASAAAAAANAPVSAAVAPVSASTRSHPTTAAAAPTAPAVAPLRVGVHLGDPNAFHPKVTPELVSAHAKTKNQPTLKKQRTGTAAF